MPNEVPFTVAAVQAAPVFLDRDATVEKACGLIAAAAREGARLVVLPEAFVPGYPDWLWLIAPREKARLNALYSELLAQSVDVPGPATERLAQAAREAGAWVVIGVNERNAEASGFSLYNTMLVFDDEGRLIVRHRKLVPTAAERMVWARGDGSTLLVHPTPFGGLAGLICWENYLPLARYALYAMGAQILASITWDHGETWVSTLRHIAKEGRLLVIGCGQAVRREDIPDRYDFKGLYPEDRVWINPGDSAIVDPEGRFLAGPVREQEAILRAEVTPSMLSGPRWMLDVAGHYARPDLFHLTVTRAPQPMVTVQTEPPVAVPPDLQIVRFGEDEML